MVMPLSDLSFLGTFVQVENVRLTTIQFQTEMSH